MTFSPHSFASRRFRRFADLSATGLALPYPAAARTALAPIVLRPAISDGLPCTGCLRIRRPLPQQPSCGLGPARRRPDSAACTANARDPPFLLKLRYARHCANANRRRRTHPGNPGQVSLHRRSFFRSVFVQTAHFQFTVMYTFLQTGPWFLYHRQYHKSPRISIVCR